MTARRRGLLAALAQAGAGELAAALLPRARSPLSGLGQTQIDLLPGPSVDMVVATAETRDKAMLRAGLAATSVGVGVAAAGLSRRRGQALMLAHGLLGGAAAASRPENSAGTSLAAGASAGIAGAVALEAPRLGTAGGFALGLAAVLREAGRRAADRARGRVRLPAAARSRPAIPQSAELAVPGITPLFTPNDSFYITDTVLTAPRVGRDRWRLRLDGLVERELELSLDELLGMDLVELDSTLVCVHNPVGGDRVGSARWVGVPLARLLHEAQPRSGADQVLTISATGFTAGLPVDDIGDDPAPLVALGMNGEPLTVQNGFPARIITPGIWGADANTKWLTAIRLTTWDAVSDYWDARGWPRVPGRVKPGSRIDVPRDRATLVAGSAVAAGVAWAPRSGVTGVEVSIDGGSWQPARLSPEIAPTLWRQWAFNWQAQSGRHDLRVRTLSRDEVQDEAPAPPYPRGSSGYHTIEVEVVESGARAGRFARARADLEARARLAAMAPPAWQHEGFPGAPQFDEPLPPARRGLRQLLPNAS